MRCPRKPRERSRNHCWLDIWAGLWRYLIKLFLDMLKFAFLGVVLVLSFLSIMCSAMAVYRAPWVIYRIVKNWDATVERIRPWIVPPGVAMFRAYLRIVAGRPTFVETSILGVVVGVVMVYMLAWYTLNRELQHLGDQLGMTPEEIKNIRIESASVQESTSAAAPGRGGGRASGQRRGRGRGRARR